MIWKTKKSRSKRQRPTNVDVTRRSLGPEPLEARRLLAADPIHVGVVYVETDYLESNQDVGSDSQGDRFLLSFTGGAPDTELSELRIRTDKDGDGISVGDPIFDTAPGGRGKNAAHGFRVVQISSTGDRQVQAVAEVDDGGQELVLRLSNFRAGDRLEFTLDVDEVLRNVVDLEVFNDRLDVITSGQEFQDSLLEATFNAPHFETSSADAIFLNDYGDPEAEFGLNLPPDEGDDPESRPNRSAAAVGSTTQVPKPIEISGVVWIDNDLDSILEDGEPRLPNVEIKLWKYDSNGDEYVDTGLSALTDGEGRYLFPKSLGIAPGRYRVTETQPEGLYSVAAVPGTVGGVTTGQAESMDALTDLDVPSDAFPAVNYNFAEAQPASLAGFVYRDDNDDGRRDSSEIGIAGVQIRLVPINTMASQTALTVTTSDDGSYRFTGLVPGHYEVIEVNQPAGLFDGKDTAGTIQGQTVGAAENDRIINVTLQGNASGVEYNFGEIPPGSLSGFVYLAAPGEDCVDDHDAPGSTPLPGIELELQTESGFTVARVTTGADGGYRFDNLPQGSYRIIQFTPPNLIDDSSSVGRIGTVRVGNSVNGGLIQEITLAPGATGTAYNFCESSPATISGHVYHDQSNDGVLDNSEPPIPAATVSLVDASGTVVAVTQTDQNGRYEFDGLEPGQYTLIEDQPSGFLDGMDSVGLVDGRVVGRLGSENDTITGVVLRQGENATQYNFGEITPASLSGRVHVDLDDDCVLDPGEQTLAGVVIRLLDEAGNQIGQVETNDRGEYHFADLHPGNYTVVQEQPEGFLDGNAMVGSAGGDVGTNRIGNITLSAGEVAVDYDFCERKPAELSGFVFADDDGDCFFDPAEPGIQGATVELYDGSGNLLATTQTDASGAYRFSNLPAGDYTIREIQPAGWIQGGQRAGSGGGDDSVPDVISSIAVGWGQRLTHYNFCELQPSSLSGQVYVDGNGDCVRDDHEPPLAGVTIQLRDAAGNHVAQTTTDADGQYRFDDLAPGFYQIFELQPEGYFDGGESPGTGDGSVLGDDLLGVNLLAHQTLVDYDFCEVAESSIEGRVWQESIPNQIYEPQDTPVPGVLIELIDEGGDVIGQTTTDGEGVYRFHSLPPGIYSVRETQPDNLFHGGQLLGNLGGDVGGDDLLIGIELTGGNRAMHYDFPEVPPATISGYVFLDGEAIVSDVAPDPTQLRDFKDGKLTADDTRLGGVEIELRNVLGLPFDSSRALPGIYPDGPIRTITDSTGYYEFTGLRPGTYHVYQVQPEDFIDGLDTPGTTGGFAVNPADQPEDSDRITIQTLTLNERTDPRNDAILNVSLAGGESSTDNNFSEIALESEPIIGEPEAPNDDPTPIADPVIETFPATVRLVTFAAPPTFRAPVVMIDEWAVSWHLSVINGGYPRGEDDTLGVVRSVSTRVQPADPVEGEHSSGRWTRVSADGQLTEVDSMILGEEGGTALTGDFNGDGSDEAVIYLAGQWFVDLNGNGQWDAGDLWLQLGTALDRPVVGDWDGDGKDDIGIFGRQWQHDPYRIKRDAGLPDPANHRRRQADTTRLAAQRDERIDEPKRLLRRGADGNLRADAVDHVFQYGEQADHPLAGDWNGDGIDQIAIFRDGQWLLDADGDGRWTTRDEKADFGLAGDEPIVGDFNGDGIDEIGVVRGDTWIIDTDGDRRLTGNDLQVQVPRPSESSQPVVGDFDGDGKDEPGYYDEAA